MPFGTLLPLTQYQEPPSWPRSPAITARHVVTFPFATFTTKVQQLGTRQESQPINEIPRQQTGRHCPNFGADWYHRIHLLPSTLDLGNLISPVERVLEVWNAHFDGQILTAINRVVPYLKMQGAVWSQSKLQAAISR